MAARFARTTWHHKKVPAMPSRHTPSSMRSLVPSLLCGLLLLSGCSLLPPSLRDETGKGATSEAGAPQVAFGPQTPDRMAAGAPAEAAAQPKVFKGTGTFVSGKPPAPSPPAGPEEASLNFEALDVREVAKVILGDYLKVSYTVHPQVSGTVTFRTIRPIPLRDLLPTLEMLLRQNNAAVVREERHLQDPAHQPGARLGVAAARRQRIADPAGLLGARGAAQVRRRARDVAPARALRGREHGALRRGAQPRHPRRQRARDAPPHRYDRALRRGLARGLFGGPVPGQERGREVPRHGPGPRVRAQRAEPARRHRAGDPDRAPEFAAHRDDAAEVPRHGALLDGTPGPGGRHFRRHALLRLPGEERQGREPGATHRRPLLESPHARGCAHARAGLASGGNTQLAVHADHAGDPGCNRSRGARGGDVPASRPA